MQFYSSISFFGLLLAVLVAWRLVLFIKAPLILRSAILLAINLLFLWNLADFSLFHFLYLGALALLAWGSASVIIAVRRSYQKKKSLFPVMQSHQSFLDSSLLYA